MEEKKVQLAFTAIEKEIIKNIPTLEEVDNRGRGYVNYGGDNLYPEYLYGLYNDCTTLKTVIEGTSDFVAGNDCKCLIQGFEKEMNRKGDTLMDIIKWTSRDYLLYGSFALQVIRNGKGGIAEIYYLNMRHIRSDKYNQALYYSEDFTRRYGRSSKVLVYPKFVFENVNEPTSIVFVKNSISTTYAVPRYSGAIKACEIERHIDEMHLSSLENGFLGSYLISFLNGIPSDEQKAEIEKDVNEKFAGAHNAGRILLNFANSKDNAVQLDKLEVEDFGEKYKAAAKRSREQIYTAFQAVPAIFGLMTESKGFNQEEFSEAFKLFNRTMVKTIQRKMSETFDKIFGVEGSIAIEPFTLEDKAEEIVN